MFCRVMLPASGTWPLSLTLDAYNMNTKLPLADPGRAETAERIFSDYKTMPPEEWVAKFSHTIGASSFDQYRYENAELDGWIHRLHKILSGPEDDISIYRRQYLSEQEIKDLEGELNDPNGL